MDFQCQSVIGSLDFLFFQFFYLFLNRIFSIVYPLQARLLDNDLGAVVKAGESFDWQRINFVLEDRYLAPFPQHTT